MGGVEPLSENICLFMSECAVQLVIVERNINWNSRLDSMKIAYAIKKIMFFMNYQWLNVVK